MGMAGGLMNRLTPRRWMMRVPRQLTLAPAVAMLSVATWGEGNAERRPTSASKSEPWLRSLARPQGRGRLLTTGGADCVVFASASWRALRRLVWRWKASEVVRGEVDIQDRLNFPEFLLIELILVSSPTYLVRLGQKGSTGSISWPMTKGPLDIRCTSEVEPCPIAAQLGPVEVTSTDSLVPKGVALMMLKLIQVVASVGGGPWGNRLLVLRPAATSMRHNLVTAMARGRCLRQLHRRRPAPNFLCSPLPSVVRKKLIQQWAWLPLPSTGSAVSARPSPTTSGRGTFSRRKRGAWQWQPQPAAPTDTLHSQAVLAKSLKVPSPDGRCSSHWPVGALLGKYHGTAHLVQMRAQRYTVRA